MSVTIETIISCDLQTMACSGNAFADGDQRNLTAKQQRANFKSSGWKRLKGKDCCAECLQWLKQQQPDARRA